MWGGQEEVKVQAGRIGLAAGLKVVLLILRVMNELRMEMFDLEAFILNEVGMQFDSKKISIQISVVLLIGFSHLTFSHSSLFILNRLCL